MRMSEWKEYQLGDLLKIKYGKDHKKLGVGNIPVYGSGGIMRTGDAYLSDKPSVLIPRKGTLSNIFYVEDPFWTVDTMFWSEINDSIVIPKYLYYAIKDYKWDSLNVGSAVPSLTVPVIESVSVSIPSLETQQKITSQLSEIDDKITVNRQICENLESQAHALFKHWFIDFAPFKDGKFVESDLGMIPEGWRVGKLTEIADYLNGLAMQKFPPLSDDDAIPVLKIKELGQSRCDNNSDKCSKQIKAEYIIKDGDVVFSWSGTLLVDIWCGGICGLNQHLFKVTSDNYPKWFYLMWTKHHLSEFIRIAKDKAVTMGHIKRSDLEKALVAIPDKSVLDKMSELMNELVDAIINMRLESTRLSALRDALLPKLMSGQIKL